MRIPEHVMDKESDFEPGADPELSAEKALNEWGIRSRESRDSFERRHRGDDRRSDRYASMYVSRVFKSYLILLLCTCGKRVQWSLH